MAMRKEYAALMTNWDNRRVFSDACEEEKQHICHKTNKTKLFIWHSWSTSFHHLLCDTSPDLAELKLGLRCLCAWSPLDPYVAWLPRCRWGEWGCMRPTAVSSQKRWIVLAVVDLAGPPGSSGWHCFLGEFSKICTVKQTVSLIISSLEGKSAHLAICQ